MTNNVPKKKVLLAGIVMLSFLATVSLIPASAQERGTGEEQVREKVRPQERPDHTRNMTLVIGIGAAVDTEENMLYRSHFKFGIAKVSSSTETDTDYQLKAGVIVINDEG